MGTRTHRLGYCAEADGGRLCERSSRVSVLSSYRSPLPKLDMYSSLDIHLLCIYSRAAPSLWTLATIHQYLLALLLEVPRPPWIT